MNQNYGCGTDLNEKADEAGKKHMEELKAKYESFPSEYRENYREFCKKPCEEYMETDSYNNGETDTVGYLECCDMFSYCGGTSGWVIFLIILIVIGCLAAAGAAFWFFYWKRKMGGRDEEEKEVESGEDTTKSGYDISVDTY
ncbi:unnamed protein product [Caenorhabditis nigoni]